MYASGGDGQKRRKEEKRTLAVRETVKLELKTQLEPELDSS